MLSRHRATITATAIGLVLFAALNTMMVAWHTEAWTNNHLGYWSNFSRYFTLSGYDMFTYVTVSEWRPLYDLLRHPLLSVFMWPVSWLNGVVGDWLGMNTAIYIVAVLWTAIDTATWVMLFRLLRRLCHSATAALLLCAFYYGLAYVMLTAIAPDHMVISQALLLLTLTIATSRRGLTRTRALLLFFFATGVTLTNGVKVWLADVMTTHFRLRRHLLYIVPLLVLAAAYIYQQRTTEAEELASREHIWQEKIKKDSTQLAAYLAEKKAPPRKAHQLVDSPLFAFTDNTVPRWPMLYENIFGEGLLLHSDYLLQDANNHIAEKRRPVIVPYRTPLPYIVNAAIVLLLVCGLWCGRHERTVQIAAAWFVFDMLLHVALLFAATDVYIMTAHWAFVIPLAVATLVRRHRWITLPIAALTAVLWWHNLTLISHYLHM